jgi:LysM repeat protein
MDSAPYPQAEADEARTYPTQGVLVQPPVRLGMIRLLSWLALLTALAALVFSLLLPPSPAQTPAALELTESALSGAIAERVAKLEKDVSSLLLKMVTLEKNMEEAKNIAPAATSDLSARISALSGQVNDLGNKINLVGIPGSSSPASGTAAAGRVPSPPQAQAVPALNPAPPPNPVASSQVEERAGSKPPPLAAGASAPSNPSGQPRERYVVQPGDTLFAIAKNFNVAARDLRAWNGMAEDDVLKSGRVLVIY